MEYITASSSITTFWGQFFLPIIKTSLILFLMRFILGKDRFNGLELKLSNAIKDYSKKIKYHERLNKAAPIVSIFLFFSFLYFFSMFCSTIESFIPLHISFGGDNRPSRETVLSVWEYYPYIEDFHTLQNVVYYKASESGLDTARLLSEAGLRKLPELLLRSLIIFVLILLSFLFIFLILRIYKRGLLTRVSMILRAILVLLILTFLFVGVSFLNEKYIDDYSIRAWRQCESQLLSSGAPPESEINIKEEKFDEANDYIEDNDDYDFHVTVRIGSASVTIIYTNYHFEFMLIPTDNLN